MKKISLLLFALFIVIKWSNAQCDKKVVWSSVKEEFLNDSGQVEHAGEDSVIIETSNTSVLVNHNNIPQDELKGTVTGISCDWKEPYKNGKTTIKTNLTEASGESNEGTITIEGKDGQISIILEIHGKKIKIYVAKYEEKS